VLRCAGSLGGCSLKRDTIDRLALFNHGESVSALSKPVLDLVELEPGNAAMLVKLTANILC